MDLITEEKMEERREHEERADSKRREKYPKPRNDVAVVLAAEKPRNEPHDNADEIPEKHLTRPRTDGL